MDKLKALIEQEKSGSYDVWFQKIAELLMRNYLIATHQNKYRITEIEFYYYSESHPDKTTYGFVKDGTKYSERVLRHKRAQCKTLTWFFHYSGVDLVIGKENEPGGILIRSIENVNQRVEEIKGPLVVLLELLNQGVRVDGFCPLALSLIPCDTLTDFSLETKERVGLGKVDVNKYKFNYTAKKTAKI